MTAFRLTHILPCSSFFSEGRIALGLLVLCMQLSLVLWPVAAHWARRATERSDVERLLAELSDTYRVPPTYYPQPTKRFRQLA